LGEAERCCHEERFDARRYVKKHLRGFAPDLGGGGYTAPPDLLSGFREREIGKGE